MLHKIVPDDIKKIVNITGSVININTMGSLNSLNKDQIPFQGLANFSHCEPDIFISAYS